MNTCVLFDIDSTLANIDHRIHFIKSNPKDWNSFFAACVYDTVIDRTANFMTELKGKHKIISWTGRPSNYKEETKKWFKKNNLYYDYLIMRKVGDRRPDYVVKEEMLLKIKNKINLPILFAFDDKKEVIDMLKRNKIPCFNCNGLT